MAAGDTSVLTQVTQEVLTFLKDVAQEISQEYPQGFGLVEVSTKEVRQLIRQALAGNNDPMEKYDGRNAIQELEYLEQRNGPLVWAEVDAVLKEYGVDAEQVRAMIPPAPAEAGQETGQQPPTEMGQEQGQAQPEEAPVPW